MRVLEPGAAEGEGGDVGDAWGVRGDRRGCGRIIELNEAGADGAGLAGELDGVTGGVDAGAVKRGVLGAGGEGEGADGGVGGGDGGGVGALAAPVVVAGDLRLALEDGERGIGEHTGDAEGAKGGANAADENALGAAAAADGYANGERFGAGAGAGENGGVAQGDAGRSGVDGEDRGRAGRASRRRWSP